MKSARGIGTAWSGVFVMILALAHGALADGPVIVATGDELQRLLNAYRAGGPARDILNRKIKQAEGIIATETEIPAGGGQGKHRYVCSACEVRLRTVDDTHHKCPKCGQVYSGEPYDGYIHEKRHKTNFKALIPVALAWTLTQEERYATWARDLLLGYAERYSRYPYHHALDRYAASLSGGGHVFSQTLTEATYFVKYIAPAYDLFRSSASFTPEARSKIAEGFLLPMLANIRRHRMGKSNWQSWHNAASFAGGALLGDSAMMEQSIADPKHGFDFQMTASISTEGGWYENSWAYHFYALSALIRHAEFARRTGIDLWAKEPLREMALLPYAYTMPNGELPRFGDDPGILPDLHPVEAEAAWRALGAVELAPSLPKVWCWESILYGRDPTRPPASERPSASSLLKQTGYAILRRSGPAGLTVAMTAAPHGPHGHLDKLGFVLFGYGKELGVDPGRGGGYEWPIHLEWYKATLSHNTVTVNGRSQVPTKGIFRLFGSNDTAAAVQAVCYAAYPGVRHTRSLVLTDRFLVVVDELKGGEGTQFHWSYHNTGTQVACPDAAEKGGVDPHPVTYVKDMRTGTTDGLVRAVFQGEGLETRVMVTSTSASRTALTGRGPGPGDSEIPFVRVGCTGGAVTFAAVIEPVLVEQVPVVQDLVLDRTDEAITVKLALGDEAAKARISSKQIVLSQGGRDVLSVSR